MTDPRGHVRRVTFNADGYTLSDTRAYGETEAETTTSDRSGTGNFITTATDSLQAKTASVRDAFGNPTTVTRCLPSPDACTDTSPGALTTRYTYDPRFQDVATITDPLSHTTTYGYDEAGNLTSVTDPLQHQTTFGYSPQGQLTAVTDALQHTTRFDYVGGDLATITDPLGQITRRFTDAGGRLQTVTDPLGAMTRYTYDRTNQVLTITDAINGQTTFSYFPDGQLQTVTDANQHTTSYTYDEMGRQASRTDPLQRQETFTYDENGNPETWTDRKGQRTTRAYDVLDRLHQITYADSSTITYTYDERDRVTHIDDSVPGAWITRTYDDFDRLTLETTAQGSISYTHDDAGRRATMTVQGQPQVIYTYDEADRLTGLTRDTLAVGMTYDDANRRATLTLPNGIVTEYGYDDNNQVTAITYRNGATTLGDLTYMYDAAGRRTQIGGSWARTGLPQAMASASYDAANELTAWGGDSRQYNANGSLASDGLTSYTWDTRQRLSGMSGSTSASFTYDPAGRRRAKTINGVSTSFLYDGITLVQELSGATPIANSLTGLGIDETFTRTDGSGDGTLLIDALRSTLALADASGTVQTRYAFEPFGATTASGAANGNGLQFTGRENDGTGLYYYRARYYSTGTGRFVSEDPVGRESGASLYGYATNNPISFADPFGLSSSKGCDCTVRCIRVQTLLPLFYCDGGYAHGCSCPGGDGFFLIPQSRWFITYFLLDLPCSTFPRPLTIIA